MTNEELDKKFKKIKSDLEEIEYINFKFEEIDQVVNRKDKGEV